MKRRSGLSKSLASLVVAVAVLSTANSEVTAQSGDALDEALALEGLERSDLGLAARGYWSRFPADIPYMMRHFEPLLAEATAIPTFARTAGNALRDALSPEAIDSIGDMGATPLHQVVYALGVERGFGGLRGYTTNLIAPETPDLVDALLAVHVAGGRALTFRSFGHDASYPDYRTDLNDRIQVIPEGARVPIARLIVDLVEAHRWVELAFRRVDLADRQAVQNRYDLSVEITDALEYLAEADDVMFALDRASLLYGGLKATAAVDRARIELATLGDVPEFSFDWETPLGWIRIRGDGDDAVDGTASFVIIDLGGDDHYSGPVAASSTSHSLSILLDLAGDDRYEADTRPAQGAGMGGVGVLVDVSGDDHYQAVQDAQGYAQMGVGVLADFAGDDSFVNRYAGQGAAIFGVGMLVDAEGDDSYQIESDGQGFGGPGGVGTLADRAGNDSYEAIRDPAITGRPSYHSNNEVAVSNAQGVGLGRRGDGSDGHSWAGGLGQLIDLNGDDVYRAGNWSMGTGYWFGTGILYDATGDDRYEGVVWSQATGAHFCIGALIDDGGNDHHLAEGGRNSLSFAHDFCVTLLLNRGGDDVYNSPAAGLGYAINRSIALAIDVGGDDQYALGEEATPGVARYDEKYSDRTLSYSYWADAASVALFLDVGGEDDYQTARGEDDTSWLESDDATSRDVNNWSIGVDRSEGEVNLLPYSGLGQ